MKMTPVLQVGDVGGGGSDWGQGYSDHFHYKQNHHQHYQDDNQLISFKHE